MILDANGRLASSSKRELLEYAMGELFKAFEESDWGASVIFFSDHPKHPKKKEFVYGINPKGAQHMDVLIEAMATQMGTAAARVYPNVSLAAKVAHGLGPNYIKDLQDHLASKVFSAIQEGAQEWIDEHVQQGKGEES